MNRGNNSFLKYIFYGAVTATVVALLWLWGSEMWNNNEPLNYEIVFIRDVYQDRGDWKLVADLVGGVLGAEDFELVDTNICSPGDDRCWQSVLPDEETRADVSSLLDLIVSRSVSIHRDESGYQISYSWNDFRQQLSEDSELEWQLFEIGITKDDMVVEINYLD